MGRLGKAVLYTALLVFANAARPDAPADPAVLPSADPSAIAALREGDMRKLVVHDVPQPVPVVEFGHLDGSRHSLADYRGKWVLLNFWATWCAPCRKEMPMFAALQREFADQDFAVVTVATGRNSPRGIESFFAEIGVDSLPRYIDPDHDLARPMAVLGLPVTVIVDPEGREVARLLGEATWDGDSAKAILRALMAAP